MGAVACAAVCAAALASCSSAPTATAPAITAAAESTPAVVSPQAPSSPAVGSPSDATSTPPASPKPAPAQASREALSTEAPVLVSPSPSDSATASASPTPTASDSVPPTDNSPAVAVPQTPIGFSPLNGLPITSINPVLVMKLDNTRYAQPHAGLTKADLVYLEEVEYGITRLAAVFSSSIPSRIGPVRSARITDIDLLAQYGKPAFGYSGAQHRMWPVLAAASIFDVSPYKTAVGYTRDFHRRAPYNLYFNGQTGKQKAPKATKAKDMGFVFSDEIPAGGLTAKSASMAWSYASAGFTYDKSSGLYSISLNGLPARAEESKNGQRAATVVIQYVKQTPSKFFDKGGGNTPHAETIGSGTALVMRDGIVWKTTWTRPNAKSGTQFLLPDGTHMAFKPGQLWIVLMDKKRPAKVTPLKPRPVPPAPVASASAAAAPSPAPSAAPSVDAATSASASPTP